MSLVLPTVELNWSMIVIESVTNLLRVVIALYALKMLDGLARIHTQNLSEIVRLMFRHSMPMHLPVLFVLATLAYSVLVEVSILLLDQDANIVVWAVQHITVKVLAFWLFSLAIVYSVRLTIIDE